MQYKFYNCKENVQKLREASGIYLIILPSPPFLFLFINL